MFNFASRLMEALKRKKTASNSPSGKDKMVEMNASEIKRAVRNSDYRPNIYAIMRALSTGKYVSNGRGRGFRYHNHESQARKDRRLRQIEKGMIQVSPEYVPKQQQPVAS